MACSIKKMHKNHHRREKTAISTQGYKVGSRRIKDNIRLARNIFNELGQLQE